MLTRQQINHFAKIVPLLRVAPRCNWQEFHALGLITHQAELTPAGHDLLATVPHLPPEPAPVAPPACKRCGGETEVPVFMGPLMMPCPACANDDGSPKRERLNIAGADDQWMWRTPPMPDRAESQPVLGPTIWYGEMVDPVHGLVFVPCGTAVQVGDQVRGDGLRGLHVVVDVDCVSPRGTDVRVRELPRDNGWTLIDSEAVARSFVGARVEIDAPAGHYPSGSPFPEHYRHRGRAVLDDVGQDAVTGDGWSICWRTRGNVRLRRVGP
jgi:hypothetical protein